MAIFWRDALKLTKFHMKRELSVTLCHLWEPQAFRIQPSARHGNRGEERGDGFARVKGGE
jgi:hypothetical protein